MRALPSMMSRGGEKAEFSLAGRVDGGVLVGHPSGVPPRSCGSHPSRKSGALVRVIMLSAAFAMWCVGACRSWWFYRTGLHGADVDDMLVTPGRAHHERFQAGVLRI